MNNLKKELIKVENKLQSITMDYSRKIINRPCDDMYLLRQSLIYRNGAIGFQLDLIDSYQKDLKEKLDQKNGFEIAQSMVLSPSRKLNYLFDDLIFNLISFFDYFAAFIIYIFYGQEIRNTAEGYDPLSTKNNFEHLLKVLWKINWTEFAKLCMKDESSRLNFDPKKIYCSDVTKEVLKHDESFIYPLSKLRNDIIHNKASLVGQSLSYNTVEGANFAFYSPGKFQELFPNQSESYLEAIEFLITKFSSCVIDFQNSLLSDIEENREVAKGDEWIKFKSEL